MLIRFLILCLLFTSCSKDPKNEDDKKAYMKFKIGSKLYEYTEFSSLGILKNNLPPSSTYKSQYTLSGYKSSITEGFYIKFRSTTNNEIIVGNYSSIGGFSAAELGECDFDGIHYSVQNGDEVKVNITRIDNGYINGTFSFSMATYPGATKRISINEGEFRNVKLMQ